MKTVIISWTKESSRMVKDIANKNSKVLRKKKLFPIQQSVNSYVENNIIFEAV